MFDLFLCQSFLVTFVTGRVPYGHLGEGGLAAARWSAQQRVTFGMNKVPIRLCLHGIEGVHLAEE